eukprot:5407308-Pyramimonas_sp.AAC.2
MDNHDRGSWLHSMKPHNIVVPKPPGYNVKPIGKTHYKNNAISMTSTEQTYRTPRTPTAWAEVPTKWHTAGLNIYTDGSKMDVKLEDDEVQERSGVGIFMERAQQGFSCRCRWNQKTWELNTSAVGRGYLG